MPNASSDNKPTTIGDNPQKEPSSHRIRSTRESSPNRSTARDGSRRELSSKSTSKSSSESSSNPSNRPSAQSGDQAIKRPPILLAALVIALLIALLFLSRFCSSAATIDVTVNDAALTLHGAKTMQTAIRESGLPINPGDLISIRGTILKKTGGEPFNATVNGNKVLDPNFQLHTGDVITVADGEDIVEDYDISEEVTPHSAYITGAGAIHSFTAGSDGVIQVKTGRQSGEVVRRQTSDETDASCLKWNPEVGEDKVLALTFDEGPSDEFTSQVLDVLKENNAHATFFCVGVEIEKYNEGLVQREFDEGHLVCTDTYDHARSADGMSVASLDEETLVYQVEHGREVIADALGDRLEDGEASRIVRLPGGQLTEQMVHALGPYVKADIGWNTDTGDWMEFGADGIYDVLMNVEPGDIVLLHDGGGDRTGTVEALRRALPLLRQKGYSFVTIEDLMEYPQQ